MKIDKSYLFLSVFFFCWSILTFFSYDVAYYSQAPIQYVSGGFSFFKHQLFLIWAGICFLALAFPFSLPAQRINKFIYGTLCITFLLNIFSHFYFSYLYQVPSTLSNVVVTAPHFTRSRLMHTHAFKPVIMMLVDLIGIDPISFRGDPGTPFYNLMPRWIYGMGFIFYFLTIVGLLVLLKNKEKEWRNGYKWPFVVSFVITSYVIIKSCVDGGPVSMESMLYFPVFISLLLTPANSYGKFLKFFGVFFSGAIILYGILYQWIDPRLIKWSFRHVGGMFIFFFLINSLLLVTTKKEIRYFPILILTIFILAKHIPGSLWGSSRSFVNQEVNPGDRIYYSNYFKKEIPHPIKYQAGDLKMHEITVKEPGKIWDYQKEFKIPPAYFNLSIVNRTCYEGKGYTRKGRLRIIDYSNVSMDRTADYLDSFRLEDCEDKDQCDYVYEAHIKGCLPDVTHELVIHQLKLMGFDSFVILDRDFDKKRA